MTIHCLQHDPEEGPGGIAEWAEARGVAIRAAHLYRRDPEPAFAAGDWLVVLGGGMNVYETNRFPFLDVERRIIRESIDAGRVVLGICLGSQLLADVLGGPVTRNAEPEIGWHTVRKTDEGRESPLFAGFPDEAEVFQWHGDTWALPPGAVRVMGSEGCANQAFVLGDRTVGIQFHPEMTPGIARAVADAAEESACSGTYVQPKDEILRDDGRFGRMRGWLWSLLDALARSG